MTPCKIVLHGFSVRNNLAVKCSVSTIFREVDNTTLTKFRGIIYSRKNVQQFCSRACAKVLLCKNAAPQWYCVAFAPHCVTKYSTTPDKLFPEIMSE